MRTHVWAWWRHWQGERNEARRKRVEAQEALRKVEALDKEAVPDDVVAEADAVLDAISKDLKARRDETD